MSKFLDFDAMWAESQPKEKDRPRVRAFGEEVILPASIPALVVLRAMRYAQGAEDPGSVLTDGEVIECAVAIYGSERIDRWLAKGMTLGQLSDLFVHALRLYNPAPDGDAGNATAPEKGAPSRSSKAGG